MFQIFLNYLQIFIIPIFIGALTRLAFIKKQKGFIVSIVFACIFVIVGLYAILKPSHGSEVPVLYTVITLCMALSSSICGLVSLVVRKGKHEK